METGLVVPADPDGVPNASHLTDIQVAALFLARQGYLRFTGGSMFPVLREGDLVCPAAEVSWPPRRGDLVAFCRHGEVWVHRVMAIETDALLTRGDALVRFDALVERGDVLGLLDGLYEPQVGATVPFRGRRAFYNAIFRRLAGRQPVRARLGWLFAALLRKLSQKPVR